MGFFDGLCSLVSGFFEGVGRCLSGAISCLGKIGSSLLSIARPLVETVAKICIKTSLSIDSVLNILYTAVQIVAVICGLWDKNKSVEDVEELGEKYLTAREKDDRIDKIYDYAAFMDTVNNTQLSPDRDLNRFSKQTKFIAGLSVLCKAIELKEDISIEVYTLFAEFRDFFTPERIEKYTNYCRDHGLNLNDILPFFSSQYTYKDQQQAKQILFQAEKSIDPQLDENSFDRTLELVKHGDYQDAQISEPSKQH